MAFTQPIDIINDALLDLGLERIRSLTEQSINAIEGVAAYDNQRLVELRRNLWTFATRRVILRALTDDTKLFTPAAYAAGTTYGHGAVVTYGGAWWESQVGTNLAHTPEAGSYWQHYFGADSADPYDADTTYASGELAIGSNNGVYRSLTTGNAVDPVAVGTGWLALGGTAAALTVLYPLGSGSANDSSTRNIFRLPKGFLRRAPTDPKAGVRPYLGGPVNHWSEDWVFEGGYIVTGDIGQLFLRYVADATNVAAMDPMFCDALAARIAVKLGPRVVEAGKTRMELLNNAQSRYRRAVFEARMVNGIEAGPVEPWEDDYVTVRY